MNKLILLIFIMAMFGLYIMKHPSIHSKTIPVTNPSIRTSLSNSIPSESLWYAGSISDDPPYPVTEIGPHFSNVISGIKYDVY
jgi:hypothetical protein